MGKDGISTCYQLNKSMESEDGGRRETGGRLGWGGDGGMHLHQPFLPLINPYLSVFPCLLM